MGDQTGGDQAVLLVRLGGCLGALPLGEVLECMRPLPVVPLAEVPAGVLGLVVVRGESLPAIDLGAMVGMAPAPSFGRFVAVRAGDRRVVFAVAGVEGIARLDLAALPPLLDGAPALGSAVKDQALVMLLGAARLVPEALRETLEAAG